jgi:hypothetical protein
MPKKEANDLLTKTIRPKEIEKQHYYSYEQGIRNTRPVHTGCRSG